MEQFVGLDVHKEVIYQVVLDKEGNIIREGKIKSEPEEIEKFLKHIDKDSKIALESCSCWEFVYDFISDMGYNHISLANPSRIGLIAKSKTKTDKHDAKVLADLLRTNMLPMSYAPDSIVRDQRRLTRHREAIGKVKGIIKNKIHAILLRNGLHQPFSDAFGNAGIDYLNSLDLNEMDRYEMDQYLDVLKKLDKVAKDAEEKIRIYVELNPHAKLIISIPGIAEYSALMIVAEIGDIRRFKSAKHLTSFAGLNPSVYQSSNTCHVGHISKQGDKHLRWILCQCANVAVEHDSHLAKIYNRIKKKKGHNVAITAVARKMLCYIFTMMNNNITYQKLQIHKMKAS